MESIIFCFSVALVGILVVLFSYIEINRLPAQPEIQKIGNLIHDGAMAYLKKQYQIMIPIVIIVSVVSFFLFNLPFSLFYLMGSFFSISMICSSTQVDAFKNKNLQMRKNLQ